MGNAARANEDKVKHKSPHCHAPIHPAAPVPTPVPHPSKPMKILVGCPTVKTNNKPQAQATNMSEPCMMPPCVPAGPGMIAMGSMTVMVGGLPAARKGDMVAFASCVAPIPGPVGDVQGPCSSDVKIGG